MDDDNNWRLKIVDAGAVPPLVALLTATETEEEDTHAGLVRIRQRQMQAAGALGNLALKYENIQITIAETENAIPGLVKLLSGTAGQKVQAAFALGTLAELTGNQVNIADAEPFLPLLTCCAMRVAPMRKRNKLLVPCATLP